MKFIYSSLKPNVEYSKIDSQLNAYYNSKLI